MKQSDVEGAREHIMVALQKYEGSAVLVAGLSVAGYIARELLQLGVASPRFIVIVFGKALEAAFEKLVPAPPEQRDETGWVH